MSDIRQGRIGQCIRCGGLLSFCLCDKAVDKAKMSDVKVTKSPHIPDDVRNARCPFCDDWFHRDGVVNHRVACAKRKLADKTAENASLRNAIKEAPHDVWCTRHDDDCSSFCWKALAVKT